MVLITIAAQFYTVQNFLGIMCDVDDREKLDAYSDFQRDDDFQQNLYLSHYLVGLMLQVF